MRLTTILTPLCAAFVALTHNAYAQQAALPKALGDQAILDMRQAYGTKNQARLTQLLPNVQGHALEGWGAYWELNNRLQTATRQEVDVFLARYRGTYFEDRLRNDWMLLLGQRRLWEEFSHYAAGFRMQDDPQVQCYELLIEDIQGKAAPSAPHQVLSLWYGQRNADDGCTHAVQEFYSDGRVKAEEVWQRARMGAHANRPGVVRAAVAIVSPQSLVHVGNAMGKPAAFLDHKATTTDPARLALVPLALARLASSDAVAAAAQMQGKWAARIAAKDRDYVWGSIGRWAGIRLAPEANSYFANVKDDRNLIDEQQHWKVRAALRAGQWDTVAKTIDAMSADDQQSPTWAYWRARALLASGKPESQALAQRMLQGIAGTVGFYEQLAKAELGGKISVVPEPAALTADEKARARTNPSLLRSIYAINIGLRSEGVREWNYATNLHDNGGLTDRDLLAAADLACEYKVWDRCINTSERTQSFMSFSQRYPMPFHDAVVKRTAEIELDPAYVYGLIRQESRFIMDARSTVGASGLMQVMPATARWTAKKIGLTDFKASDINDKETNIAIGTAYLKLALDEFAGSMPLAAAGYNAGPGRPRNWRNGPTLEAAIWAENVPFNETRDYVQKVLANATVYGAILSGQPQSLSQRLGRTIGPREEGDPVAIADLP
ncbi:lytic transglycosylase domain-containing protein [Lampropedia puyangensis]|uniref:Lytic transglycosylase domain-containing protein n=1 Tax=Lampropedia puyangensis TaxID=1330072 RepID=A0A4S8FE16_9BURK|nr:lytic transglycosylase domain-containing protein [Lampropedia puyangensis]THU05185.1 lytic transglycosylase domain-containing protein [Lampropedia puyangensis]